MGAKGRPKRPESSRYKHSTFVVRTDLLEWLKDYAYTERMYHKDAINGILERARAEIMATWAAEGKTLLKAPRE